MVLITKKDRTTTMPRFTVINLDPKHGNSKGDSRNFRVLTSIDLDVAKAEKSVFLLSPESELKRVSPFVHELNRRRHLRGLFIRPESDRDWFPSVLAEAKIRTVTHMLLYSDNLIPERVINAWSNSEEKQTIALVAIRGDELLVKTCGFESLRIPLGQIPQLASASGELRREFRVSPAGGYVYWPDLDLHLDVEGMRSILDPKMAKEIEAKRFLHDKSYGGAVAALREAHGLRQSDIAGLSDRQVRRIESGESAATGNAIRQLAQAHGLEPNAYMQQIAGSISTGPRGLSSTHSSSR